VKIALGADHAGTELLGVLRDFVRGLGHDILDLAPPPGVKVDYPVYADRVAHAVATGAAERGILVCGSGIGVSIAANKHPGVRAALVHDHYTAQMSRLHNDANIVCLGQRVIGPGVAEDCVRAFIETAFEGGRHANRVALFSKIEQGEQL